MRLSLLYKKNNHTAPLGMHIAIRKSDYILNYLTYSIAIIAPLATFNQAVHILRSKDSSGVSVVTWIIYYIAALLLFRNAFKKNDATQKILQILMIISESFVLIGIYLYS